MEIDKSWVLSSFKSNTSQKYECKAGFKQVFKHPVYLAKCRYYLQWCSTALVTNFGVSYQRPFLKPTPRSFCSSSYFWQWILIPYGHAVWAPAQAALNIMTWCRLSHQLLKWPNHHLFFLWLKSGRRHIHWWSNQRENKAATCTGLHPMDWTFPKTPPFNSVYSPLFPLIHHQILRILGKGQFSKTKVPLFAHLQSLLSNLFDTMQTATMPGPFPGTFQRDVSPIGPGIFQREIPSKTYQGLKTDKFSIVLTAWTPSLFYANIGKADCRRNDAPFISKTVWVLDYKWSDMIWIDSYSKNAMLVGLLPCCSIQHSTHFCHNWFLVPTSCSGTQAAGRSWLHRRGGCHCDGSELHQWAARHVPSSLGGGR